MHKNKNKESGSSKNHDDEYDKEPLSDKISQNLRKLYDDVLDEPVPDDFLKLLQQADESE